MTLPATFFKDNRKILTKKGGLFVLGAYTKMQRTLDEAYKFEQEANFWYLTGIEAPDWRVIIDGRKTWLVMPEVDEAHEVFNGSLSAEKALEISGADDVLSRDDADKLLRDLARQHSLVYSLGDDPYAKYYDFAINPAPKELWRQLERIFNEVQDVRAELSRQRAIKKPEEISAIKRAIKLTNQTFANIKEHLNDFKHEYEIEAEFTQAFRMVGANHAYDPIVAAGVNAVTLHYGDNSTVVRKNDLVLLDIGAKVDGYPADITRTYATGEPSARKREVHAAVQAAQKEIIGLLRPGLSPQEYSETVDDIMKQKLIELGLLTDKSDNETYRYYFPHAISHGLGVDVHDSLGAPLELKAGMVLTVEPGIYIPKEGIGVRIEDDILITEAGHQNLSAGLSTNL